MATLKLPTTIVVAGNPQASVRALAFRSARIAEQPIPPAEINRRAKVLVHAGNHGTSCLGVRAAIPQVALSHQYEHVFDGRRIAAAGAGICLEREQWSVPAIHDAIEAAWHRPEFADSARELASTKADQFEGSPGELTADRVLAVLS